MVRDPDLRRRRPRRARARQSAVEDQPRLRLSARSPDPAAGLRSGPDQGADEAHQCAEGPRHRPEVRPDHLGRGARHDRRQDDRAAQEQRGAQARLHARPLLADLDRAPLRRAAQDLRDDQLLLAQRDLRRSREDGSRADPGLLRLPRLRPREDELPRDLGLRSARVQPHGSQHDRALPRDRGARHGDHRRPAAFHRGGEVAGVAAGQARHRRRAGGCDGPRAADRRTVEPRVRRRLQGRQEPVRRRTDGRRGSLRREGDLWPGQMVEPRAQGPHAGLGREGNADPGGADRPRGPGHGQGGPEDRRLDGPRRGDEPARHLCLDGGVRTQRPARLDRRRGWRLAIEQRADRRVPEVRRVSRRRRQGRIQVQEARRSRRQGHAGDDERAARQRGGHQQHRQRHAQGSGCGQGRASARGRTSTSPAPAPSAGTRRWPPCRSSCTW